LENMPRQCGIESVELLHRKAVGLPVSIFLSRKEKYQSSLRVSFSGENGITKVICDNHEEVGSGHSRAIEGRLN
jgi:hypothetical protein